MSEDLPQLIEQVRRRDRTAIGRMYDRFAPLVRTMCFDRTGDWHATLDVTHEVFLSVLRGLDRLTEPGRFQSWLLSITRKKLADYHRGRSRPSPSLEECGIDPPAGLMDPGEQEMQRRLCDAIGDLPQRQRFAVQMFYFEGLGAREVSELLGVPLRTVYARLLQARQSLRLMLEKSRLEALS